MSRELNPVEKPLELVRKMTYGYLHSMFDGLWGEYGSRGRGLRLTPGGTMRVGQCIGWLSAFSDASEDKDGKATKLALSFFNHMDYLSNYGGLHDERNYIPNYMVELGDDGTWGGFTILWHQIIIPENKTLIHPDKVVTRFSRKHMPIFNYVCTMNGGLLFHHENDANGGPPTFAVNLTPHTGWSCHT